MRRRRQHGRSSRVSNFQRQSQALTILTIATVIIGVVVFQADIPFKELSPKEGIVARIKVSLLLCAVLTYVWVVGGTGVILKQVSPITGADVVQRIINPLLLEIGFSVSAFAIDPLLSIFNLWTWLVPPDPP